MTLDEIEKALTVQADTITDQTITYLYNSQCLKDLEASLCIPAGITGAFVLIEDGVYKKVYVTYSSRSYHARCRYLQIVGN